MANYYATARSNYFKVKNKRAFKADCDKMGVGVWDDRKDGRVGIYPESDDEGGWPSESWPEDADDAYEFDVCDVISAHLVEGEVAILLEAGAEKLRYVHGHAIAVNSKGETRKVMLNDIYDLAKELTDRPDDITGAEY